MARRSLVLIGSCLGLLAFGLAAAPPDPELTGTLAAAKPATLSGTVRAASTGQGVADVTVQLLRLTGAPAAAAATGADGTYLLKAPRPGTYYVRVYGTAGLAGGLYDGISCPLGCDAATGTQVAVNGSVRGIDFALAASGSLSGRVTDAATDAPLFDAGVQLFDHSGVMVGATATAADGGYVFPDLPAGTFYVSTRSHRPGFDLELGPRGYLDRIYDSLPCFEGRCNPLSGAPVEVRGGERTAGVDFALTRGGRVSGTVLDAETGEPVAGTRIAVRDDEGVTLALDDSGPEGRYVASGLLAGTYFVVALAAQEHPAELYDGVPCSAAGCDLGLGTPVIVEEEAETGGVDFRLRRTTGRGSLSGKITDHGSGQAVAGVSIYVLDFRAHNGIASGSSGADGTFRFDDVPAGNVFVHTLNSLGYLNEVYDDLPCDVGSCPIAGGDPVVIEDGVETHVDIELVPGGSLTGRMTDENGQPLGSASVAVYERNRGLSAIDGTDVDGRFRSDQLRTGTYYVLARAPGGRLDEVFDDVLCTFPDCDVTSGHPVAVAAGVETRGVDFELRTGATIAGRVVDEAGRGVPDVQVRAFNAEGNIVAVGNGDEDGRYTISTLPPGPYFVGTRNASGLVDEVYSGLTCPFLTCDVTTGTPVPGDPPTATEGVDLTLSPGGSISGTVTEIVSGLPVRRNELVQVFDASGSRVAFRTVDANGRYRISGLADGAYFVSAAGATALGELHGGVPCVLGCDPTAGVPVYVRRGDETSDVDFALALGGRISGRITSRETGRLVADARVDFISEDGSPGYSTVVNPGGRGSGDLVFGDYPFVALPAGTYFVRVSAPGFAGALYDGVHCEGDCDVDAGTPVTVRVNEETSGIDFVLDPLQWAWAPRSTTASSACSGVSS